MSLTSTKTLTKQNFKGFTDIVIQQWLPIFQQQKKQTKCSEKGIFNGSIGHVELQKIPEKKKKKKMNEVSKIHYKQMSTLDNYIFKKNQFTAEIH